MKDVFLFVSEDSAVQVERRRADGTFEAVAVGARGFRGRCRGGTGESAAAQPSRGSGCRAPRRSRPERWPASAAGHQRRFPVAGRPSTTGHVRTGTQVGGLSPFPGARPHARIRVDAIQLDDLVGLAGELVVLSDNLQGLREEPRVASWLHALEALERVSREIRDTTLDLRMVPVDELFSRFPRVVRDLADRSGKEIELRIVGQETRLDRTIVERLGDPMVHLIRNAVDHALETPQERLRAGQAAGRPDHAVGRSRGRPGGDPRRGRRPRAWTARRSSARGPHGG